MSVEYFYDKGEWIYMNDSWEGERILLTGGTGFFGKHISQILREQGADVYSTGTSVFDLTDWEETNRWFDQNKPTMVIHAAGYNGGIKFNQDYPVDIFTKNIQMGLNIHRACYEWKVDKLLNIATSCAYPDLGDKILYEEEFWEGQCNETVRCHGTAKRNLQLMSEVYHEQYDMNCVTLAVTNLYGPGDTFNLDRTKVVGAVVRKVVEAHQHGSPTLEFWGTGKPKRQFMFVKDAAHAVVSALVHWNNPYVPLNIGHEDEFTIKELVKTTAKVVGYKGEILWDTTKKDGQMRKMMSVERAYKHLSYPRTSLKQGLEETVEWYLKNQQKANAGK